jgi:integral membrane protein (TIGR01906 family)
VKAISLLIIVFLAPVIVLLNFRLLVFNKNFYETEFEKLTVYSRLEPGLAKAQTVKLLDYFCCNGELNEDFFTQREIIHLKDVKVLINSAVLLLYFYSALIIAASAILVFKRNQKLLFSALKTASLVGIAALVVLFIASLLNFDFLFTKFHLISFDNDFWLLPADANLIKLFPGRFFQDFANLVAIKSLLMLSGLFLLSAYLSKK